MNRRVLGVVLPLIFQLLFVAVIILATNGTGWFVKLAAVRIFWITALPGPQCPGRKRPCPWRARRGGVHRRATLTTAGSAAARP